MLVSELFFVVQDIVDLSLSPDASVLATASKDGHLKFWQVNLDEDEVPK